MQNLPITPHLRQALGKLFVQSLQLSTPMYQLEQVRAKLEQRTLQEFDKSDILEEFGKIQQYLNEINSEMLRIHDLLKQ